MLATGGRSGFLRFISAQSVCITVLAAAVLPPRAYGADDLDALKRQVEKLQIQLQEVQRKLMERKKQDEKISEIEQKVKEVRKVHSEWNRAQSVVHLSGYGAVGYTDVENGNGTFNSVSFNPILHYQYKNLFLLEAELEISVKDTGETETALEYGAIDWFINNNVILQAGKFLSPIGQFRQNLHPAWINRFASAPPGFGHDGAAPVSEVGVQLRGGYRISNPWRINYSIYTGNGPRVEIQAGEIHGVEAEGATANADGELVFGGRLGVLPMSSLELGISAATGDVGPEGEETLLRNYEVTGADFAWKPGKSWDIRGEYVRTRVGSNAVSAAPEAAVWKTWYVQGAYRFLPGKWEAVLRYGDFNSPHADQDQKQWGAGVNYWFAPNAVAKLGYENNDGLSGSTANNNRWLLQLAYGF